MPTRNSPGRAWICSSLAGVCARAEEPARRRTTARQALEALTPAKDSRRLGPLVVVVRHVLARLAPHVGEVLLVQRPDDPVSTDPSPRMHSSGSFAPGASRTSLPR